MRARRLLRWAAGVWGAAVLSAGALPAAESPFAEDHLPGLGALLDAALRSAPRRQLADQLVALREAEVGQARAQRRPQVTAYGLGQYQSEDRADLTGTQEADKFYYSLRATQPLWHGGLLEAQERAADGRRRGAEQEAAETARAVAAEVRSGYLGLMVRQAELRAARFGVETGRLQLEADERRFATNELSEGEIQGRRLAQREAELLLRRAEAEAVRARAALARLAGVPGLTEADLPTALPPLALSGPAPADVEAPGSSGAALQRARLTAAAETEEANLRVAQRRLWPKLDAIAGVYQDEVSYSFNIAARVATRVAFIGVQVNWLVFDGWGARHEARRVRAEQRRIEIERERLERELGDEAVTGAAVLEVFAPLAEVAETKLAWARGEVVRIRGEVEAGRADALALRAKEAAVLAEESALLRVRAEWLRQAGERASLLAGDPAVGRARSGSAR